MHHDRHLPENVSPLPAHFDMEDFCCSDRNNVPDYEPGVTHEPLRKGLPLINGRLLSLYRRSDADAISNQKNHRFLAHMTIGLGFIAILFAILQFCFLSFSLELLIPYLEIGPVVIHQTIIDPLEICRSCEVAATLIAAIAVITGLWRSYQNRWLINRHIAERCRLLKFRSLLRNSFWNEAEYPAWERHLNKDIDTLCSLHESGIGRYPVTSTGNGLRAAIRALFRHDAAEPREIHTWILDTSTIPRAHISGTCSYSHDAKAEFLAYYRKKRLIYQRDYYYKRFQEFSVQGEWGQKIPHLLFFASVCAVLCHFLVDIFLPEPGISVLLIGVAVTLPFFGYVLKTFRDTFQVTKSSALYFAKYSALDDLNKRLLKDEVDLDNNWNQILDTLWECEKFLETEHREWLILILDAEWFL